MNNVFLREVRSVTVVYGPQHKGDFLHEKRMALWLKEYDLFFKTKLGVKNNQSLHLLFGRTLNILGSNLLEKLSQVLLISSAGKDCGFSVGIQLRPKDMLDMKKNTEKLLYSKIFSRIFLDFSNFPEFLERNDSVLNLVEDLIHAKMSLTILAKPEFLSRIGVLDLTAINSANFQIIPESVNPVKLNFLDPEKKQKTIPIYSVSSNKQIFDPCATRMQIFVNEYGDVYPCQGLSKLPEIALCNINSPFNGEDFSDENERFSLFNLFSKGPNMSEYSRDRDISICQQHRNMF